MIAKIRKQLRLTSTVHDEEIKQNILACLADLKVSGIETPPFEDSKESYGNALIDSCIILWAKAHFGMTLSKEHMLCYKSMKNTLVLGGVVLE